MAKTLWLICSLLAIGQMTLAQNTGALKGKIQTQKGEDVAGLSVNLANTTYGTIADEQGNFLLKNIPAGTYTLTITGIGFTPAAETVMVTAGRTTFHSLEITAGVNALQEVIVTSDYGKGYMTPNTASATRISTPLLETPQSIQVIPQQLIKDQNALSLNDLTRNVAGMQSIAPGYSYYTLRGFDSYNNGPGVITNGIRGISYDFFQTAQLYNIERVEIIKGPASALFSVGNPGGVINLVTKKPLATPQYQGTLSFDSFGDYRFIGDATGNLSKDKKLLYRLIAGYNGGKTFRKYVQTDVLFVAPSLRYNFSENTFLNAEANFTFDNTNIRVDRGIVAPPRPDGTYNFEAVGTDWMKENPNDQGHIRNTLVQLTFGHRFSDNLTFTALNSYGHSRNRNQTFGYSYGNLNARGDSLIDRQYANAVYGANVVNLNYFLTYRTTTGSLRHAFVIGADYGLYQNIDDEKVYTAPSTPIANPLITANPATFPLAGWYQYEPNYRLLGGYVQDQIDLTARLKALVSLRVDSYKAGGSASFDVPNTPRTTYINTYSALLPRFGLVYLPVKTVSLYATYTSSFNPPLGDPSFGADALKTFKPERGRQYEVGIKAELFNQKLIPTLCYYHIDKYDVVQADPTDPTGRRQVNIGQVRSQGVELTVQGNITQSLNLSGFYAYNDIAIIKDVNPANIGSPLGNAPKHSANLWLKYNVASGGLRGFGIGGGLNYVSERVGQFSAPDFKMPAYTNFDVVINYGIRQYSLAFNVHNLANSRQITGGYQPSMVFPGAPRNVRVTLGYRF